MTRRRLNREELRKMSDELLAVRRRVVSAWSGVLAIALEASLGESESGRRAVATISEVVTRDLQLRMALCEEVLNEARNTYDHLTGPLEPANVKKLKRKFSTHLRDAEKLAEEIEKDAQTAKDTLHRWLG